MSNMPLTARQIEERFRQRRRAINPRAAFKREPIKLDYSSGRVSTSFEEISIAFPKAYADGFGDILSTLKLAEGLRRKFPDKKVVIYFESQEDYDLLSRLYPNFQPSKTENELNGIIVVLCKGDLKKAMEGKGICILTPLKLELGLRDSLVYRELSDFVYPGAINFYLPEPNAQHLVSYPAEIELGRAYIERSGRLHLILPTGFGADALGINIEPSTIPIGPNAERRVRLLRSILSGRAIPNIGTMPNA